MTTTVENWEEVSREEVFRKYNRAIEKRVYRLPHGRKAEFYLSSGNDSIACLALTKDKKIILAKQFRPGPAKVLLELPGGSSRPGEELGKAVARELLEETGYLGQAKFVGSVYPSAYATYRKNIFVITECEKIAESKLEDNGEVVEAVLLSLAEFRTLLRSGQMTDVEIGYLGLDQLGLL